MRLFSSKNRQETAGWRGIVGIYTLTQKTSR
jgi:hypothetical protein